MFCFQCEQTWQGKGCTISGVCGKRPDTADFQDELINSIVRFANCAEKNNENTDSIVEGLFTTVTNVNFDNVSIKKLTEKIKAETSCDFDFDVKKIWS